MEIPARDPQSAPLPTPKSNSIERIPFRSITLRPEPSTQAKLHRARADQQMTCTRPLVQRTPSANLREATTRVCFSRKLRTPSGCSTQSSRTMVFSGRRPGAPRSMRTSCRCLNLRQKYTGHSMKISISNKIFTPGAPQRRRGRLPAKGPLPKQKLKST